LAEVDAGERAGATREEHAEIVRLRRELHRVEEEKLILQKAAAYFVWGAKNSVRLQTRRFRSSGRGARTARAAISLIDSAIGAYI
jgi:transposase-like protein